MSDATLPPGWATAKLGELGQWWGGGTPSKENPAFWDGGSIPWVSPKDMKALTLHDSEDHLTQLATEETNVKPFPPSTVLVVVRSGILSRTFPVAVCAVRGTMNQDLKGIHPATDIDPYFLAYQLIAREREILNRCSKHGTTVASIETVALRTFPVVLAPLPEQRRIVAKIEELFADLDAGVSALERVRANLKRYRASVLKAAVEGRLTADWRAAPVVVASCRAHEAPRQDAATTERGEDPRQDAATTDDWRTVHVDTASCRAPTHPRQDAAATDGRRAARVDAASCRVPPNPEQDTAATDVGFFDPTQPVARSTGGNLPHWRQDGVTYFVTFRLADSIPQARLNLWVRERDEWLARHPEPHDLPTRREYHRLFVARFERWLDCGHGECHLRRPDIRRIVVDALRHFDGRRYALVDWVVMPNHVHVLVSPFAGHDLSAVLHSWKSFTATAINRLLGRRGPLWQKESFDHIVRSAEHLEEYITYIGNNPRGLPDGEYSLAAPVAAASCRAPTTPRQDAAATEEPATALLDRILADRRKKWEADQLAKFAAAGKSPPKNWQAKYPEPAAAPDTAILPPAGAGRPWIKSVNLPSTVHLQKLTPTAVGYLLFEWVTFRMGALIFQI